MLNLSRIALSVTSLIALAVPACTGVDGGGIEDEENATAGGKADSIVEGSNESRAILAFLNDGETEIAQLDNDAGLTTRVATNLVNHRKGPDRRDGTSDDDFFDSIAEVDAVPYVGSTAMSAILEHAIELRAAFPTLTVSLVGTEYNEATDAHRKVSLDTLNAQFDGPDFPKKMTLGGNDGDKFNAMLAQLAVANEKLNRDVEMDYTWDPSDYTGLCYTGKAKDIQKTVDALRESMFSIYMGVQAERYGTTKKVFSSSDWLDLQREENPQTVAVWENYNTSSSDYLMMTDGGQQGDGTEFFAVRIKRCP